MCASYIDGFESMQNGTQSQQALSEMDFADNHAYDSPESFDGSYEDWYKVMSYWRKLVYRSVSYVNKDESV